MSLNDATTDNAYGIVQLVQRIAKELSVSSSARDRTETVIHALRQALDLQVALVYRRSSGGEAPLVYSFGFSARLSRLMTDPHVEGSLVAGLETFVNTVADSGRGTKASLDGTVYDQIDGLKFTSSFPVHSGSEVTGVLILAWPDERILNKAQLDLCAIASEFIGVALRQDILIERSAEVAVLQERARLARDIHDSVTQSVTAAVLNIEAADRALDDDPVAARQALVVAKQLARDSLGDLRRSIWNLRTGIAEWRSLNEAIEDLMGPLRAAGVRCSIEVHGPAELIPAEIAGAAISIIRESASNILRHSGSATAQIVLEATTGSLAVTVNDDGVGIGEVTGEGSFGLIGMEERAQSVGGSLKVHSGPSRGTSVEANLPYAR